MPHAAHCAEDGLHTAGELRAIESHEGAARRLAALGEMTGGIIHDFGNLLAVIEAGLTLAEASNEPQKARGYIAAARDALGRGVKLTAELLNFAKQREFEPCANDANKLLRNLEPFLNYAAGPRIAVLLDLAPVLPKCLSDPSQFNAALLNLVVNARDAMPGGGRIEIGTAPCPADGAGSDPSAPAAWVRVRVRDDGLGMSAEVAQRVFDPFFTTKGTKGTGLGLPQVGAFMRLVGGHVSVASEPGIGSTFELFFPVVTDGGVVAFPAPAPRVEAESLLEETVMSEETGEERRKRELDRKLDRELEDTFPASDPLKITLGREATPGISQADRT